ncbi:S-adenosyl-L-methionine-dependent methyltransferase [Fomes fomentarius]|nr:S-adenosyl-L-methionine-dependent methyltransferase [Fomes fomentarius]
MLLVRVPRCCSRLPLSFSSSRTYTSASSLPPLPPLEEWRKLFPWSSVARRDRVFLSNLDTARKVAQSFIKDSPTNGKGKVVIEAFPGPGTLSRALLELPKSALSKLVILEEDESYLEYLQPLQDADPRVTVVPMSGHSWDTYTYLEEQGIFNEVEAAPWEKGSIPNLHFVAHLPHSVLKGEQLIAQLFRCIPERSWLFQYGRVPMSMILNEHVWQRLSAPPGNLKRCKLSVVGEATADIQEVLDPDLLAPYENTFHPPPAIGKGAKTSRRAGQTMRVISSIPYPEQVIQKGQTDQWDYCLRRLFVLKSTMLKGALNSLAPGAGTLADVLTSTSVPREQRVNLTKKVRELNVADWALILRAFDNWPFKPDDLLIGGAFLLEDP